MKKVLPIISLLLVFIFIFYYYGRGFWHPVALKIKGKKSLTEVIQTYGESSRESLTPLFTKVGLSYPPQKLALVAFKDTNILELWAANKDEHYTLVIRYPIQAASGKLGPKLREGDRQVPEGIYQIIGFNPNSAYHLSMKLNYPNDFDLKYAEQEGRNEPGTNIFIHGKAASIGCLAMGDPVIEQLFSLVYTTGKENTTVLISPTNPSKNKLIAPEDAPAWTAELYQNITDHYYTINSQR